MVELREFLAFNDSAEALVDLFTKQLSISSSLSYMAAAMSLNALLSNSPILVYHFLMLLRPAALSHFWAKSTVILVVQEQLLLWYKNSYYYGTRTVIFMVQEQLFLWCKNSYSCDARTTVVISPFFIVLDISVTPLSHIFRSCIHVLKKKSQLWTLMDTYGQLWTLWPFVILYLCYV